MLQRSDTSDFPYRPERIGHPSLPALGRASKSFPNGWRDCTNACVKRERTRRKIETAARALVSPWTPPKTDWPTCTGRNLRRRRHGSLCLMRSRAEMATLRRPYLCIPVASAAPWAGEGVKLCVCCLQLESPPGFALYSVLQGAYCVGCFCGGDVWFCAGDVCAKAGAAVSKPAAAIKVAARRFLCIGSSRCCTTGLAPYGCGHSLKQPFDRCKCPSLDP
jgi:hypothetical protein